ncbi:MAG: phage tail sheath subtilisin-like domain-containing protein, partial [Propionicimonas sp.]|nr:phage tail sheath subtilisin-like domain-containing protein [Propionicimonas sp.]
PGVYVEEVAGGTRPFGRAGTSSAGFVGVAPRKDAPKDVVVPIDNWTQFVREFVGDATAGTHLSTAVYGFFQNGGSRAYVVNVGPNGKVTGTAKEPTGLQLLEAIDDVAIVAAPGFTDGFSYDALINHCEDILRQDRVAILDTVEEVRDINRLTEVVTVTAPSASSSSGGAGSGGAASGATDTATAPAPTGGGGLRPPMSPGGYAAVYFPWLIVTDPVSGEQVTTPPSGHIAGVWARTDATRGVHKAPANTTIAGALGLVRAVSKGEQELLNPAGVNCIRFFPGEGILIWGARTLAPEASEFRYINVRRLTNMIKETVLKNTRWAVFEPNHHPLWAALRRDCGAFLTNVWRDGALVGQTPQEAFFVKCDAETNPPEVRDEGRVVTLIGIAPVKPAEFVVFQLSQSADLAAIEPAGA